MASSYRPIPVKELFRILDEAVREGRHSWIENWRTYCDGCGQPVTGIWLRTVDKKELCRKCAEGK